MRILFIPLALAASLTAAVAVAGVPEAPGAPKTESTSVLAMRALIGRCLPSIGSGRETVTTGLRRVAPPEENSILGARQGRVWLDRQTRMLLIDFEDVPVCRVVALSVDPAVLADLVIRVFTEAEGTFKRERFRFDADGGFAAVFSGRTGETPVLVRISTTQQANGNVFASLNVERAPSTGN